jgi:hypothetical protein
LIQHLAVMPLSDKCDPLALILLSLAGGASESESSCMERDTTDSALEHNCKHKWIIGVMDAIARLARAKRWHVDHTSVSAW